MSDGISRRELLGGAAVAVASVGVVEPVSSAQPREGRRAPRQRVIVVGAGLAGLSAAWELRRAGHEVTVLEAQARAGGRVHTLREPFSDGLHAEAGAIVIHDRHAWTMHYVEQFGLELDPLPASDLDSLAWVRGHRIRIRRGGGAGRRVDADGPVDWPLDLSPEERRMGRDGMLGHYLGPVVDELGDPETPDWPPPHLEPYDQISYADLLRQRGASPAAVELLSLGFQDNLGDGAESYSALNMLSQMVDERQTRRRFTIRGGNDRLPLAFARRLAEQVRYGAPVVRIEQHDRGVRATYRVPGSTASVDGDRLVCAVPFSVLRRIEVEPAFSPEKRRAVEELPMTSVTRVYLQCGRRFWEDEGVDGGALTDLAMRGISHRTAAQPGPRGILESYRSGAGARRAVVLPETARLDSTLGDAARVHPAIREHFEVGTSWAWDEDPWARGGYIYFKPGQMFSIRPHIARPEGRIHFAGEHASMRPGWMQGALESGNRVAREILALG